MPASPSTTVMSTSRFMGLPSLRSEPLDEAPDRPDRQPAGDELPDPVPGDGDRRTEHQRDVLRLLQEAAECAILDQPQVLRRLAAQILDALDVRHGQDVP